MGSTTNSSFDEALRFITTVKLGEVEKQRVAFQRLVQALNDDPPTNPLDRVSALVDAILEWRSSSSGYVHPAQEIGGSLNLRDLRRWIAYAKSDPSFSPDVVNGWIEVLETHLLQTTKKFDCAKLFGDLFTDWLASGDSVSIPEAYKRDENDDSMSTTSSFDMVPDVVGAYNNAEHEKLKNDMFNAPPDSAFDADPLIAYLDEIFASSKTTKEELDILRGRVDCEAKWLLQKTFTARELKWTLASLVESASLPADKVKALKEFQNSPIILTEAASVINMRLKNLAGWNWPAEGLRVEFRRHALTGKIRAFTDPDLMNAILLHYIGVQLQIKFKNIFTHVFDSPIWKTKRFSPEAREKLTMLLGGEGDWDSSIARHREEQQRDVFFMNRLASSEEELTTYDDVLDASESDASENPRSPANVKKSLLRTIATESILHQSLGGTFTVFQTDLESFGPTLAHPVIINVLEYFGMPDDFIIFFDKFLKAPLHFPSATSHNKQGLRTRSKGTPTASALSALIGEVLLFIMDFAVNQKSDGLFLYRMHDDIWLWDADARKVALAWGEMQRCATTLGVKFNAKKTGSASVGSPATATSNTITTDATLPVLPPGTVRWGFLKYDAAKSRFAIDQDAVDKTITSMRAQLAATTSVFGWVNAYNKYMALFYRNMGGTPANCFGTDHLTDAIDTFARIQRELFPPPPPTRGSDTVGRPEFPTSSTGGAVGHLRRVVEERYGVSGLPEGYFYLPVEYGGLALANPLVELMGVARPAGSGVFRYCTWEHSTEPKDAFRARIDGEDLVTYESKLLHWERREIGHSSADRKKYPRFMSFEEYQALRETWIERWGDIYKRLLEVKEPLHGQMPKVVEACKESQEIEEEFFHQWNFAMHGPQLIKTFGGLKAVDPSLIPTGMVALFRTSKMATL